MSGAVKGKPCAMLCILDIVRVDGVEVIRCFRFQHKTMIHPLVVRTFGVERFVGGKRDPRCVLSEEQVGVVEAVLPMLKGDIGCPQLRGGWALLLNPSRNGVEDMTASASVQDPRSTAQETVRRRAPFRLRIRNRLHRLLRSKGRGQTDSRLGDDKPGASVL